MSSRSSASSNDTERSVKKKGGGYLARQAKAKNPQPVTDEELRQKDSISPDDVLRLNKSTSGKSTTTVFEQTLNTFCLLSRNPMNRVDNWIP